MRRRGVLALLTVFAVLTAGSIASTNVPAKADEACIHPYPCGDEWPEGLEGPFALKDVRYVRVPVLADHDDPAKGLIELEGWIGFPDLPEDVGAPVALYSTPYLGSCGAEPLGGIGCVGTPSDPAWWDDPPGGTGIPPRRALPWGVAPIDLIKRGYVAAYFNVRGTGNSGGCWDYFGRDEQLDQVALVEWLSEQDWSNGRVGMGGLSYDGTTPLEAAIHAPEALKTIVPAGIFSDPYTAWYTPQGAASNSYVYPFWLHRGASVTGWPPLGGGLEYGTVEHAPLVPERLCADALEAMVGDIPSTATDFRHEAFWDERRLIDGFGDITASVLLVHGFQDLWLSLHQFQESAVWQSLRRGPKRLIEGQWGHTSPFHEGALDDDWENNEWSEVLFEWLDYWLKGVGDTPENLGGVDYEDGSGAWHRTASWPPADARDEVLHLARDALQNEPVPGEARSFRSVPSPLNTQKSAADVGIPAYRSSSSFCPDAASNALQSAGLVYTTAPVDEPVLLAGNPFLYLRIESDLPGGLVVAYLVDVGPDFRCEDGEAKDVRYLATGAADLRFHRGNFIGEAFPTGDPTNVRVDITNLAEVIQPGRRLGLVLDQGQLERTSQPYPARITVYGDSQLILPVVSGTVGGGDPTTSYPPRPFVPAEERE